MSDVLPSATEAGPDPVSVHSPTEAGSSRIGHIPTLDGWRSIAILMVLVAHASPHIFERLGFFGVRIFFGISGFLIGSKLLEETSIHGRVRLKNFYIRRSFRIIPPLLVMMLVLLGLSSCGEIEVPTEGWLAGLFFAANYIKGPWSIGHLWSLAVEEHFYLVFPVFLAAFGVVRSLRMTALAAVGIALWRFVAFKVGSISDDFNPGLFWGRTDIVADGLLWGCIVAILHASPTRREWMRRSLRPAVWWPLCGVLFAPIALQKFIPGWKADMAVFSLQAIVIPFVLVGTVLWSEGTAGRFLESRPLRRLGRLSYSVYLWQQLFLVPKSDPTGRLYVLQQFPANFAVILIISVTSYYLVELPFIRIGHRLTKAAPAGRGGLARA